MSSVVQPPIARASARTENEVTIKNVSGPYPLSLDRLNKAEQLAEWNNTTVIARASATYTADQTIAVWGDANSEQALFMRDATEFAYYKTGLALTKSAGNTTEYLPLDFNTDEPTLFVKFVKFAGANTLAYSYRVV